MALQAEKQKSVKSRKACDDLRRLLGRQAVGCKHEIVILGLAPFAARVIVIIIRAVTVGLYDYAFGFALTERMALAYFIHSVGKIRIEENTQNVLSSLKNRVGAPPDEHRRSLCGKRFYKIRLSEKQSVVYRLY